MDYEVAAVDAAEAAVCIATGSLACLGVVAAKLVYQLFGLPDPLQLIFEQFSGRPTLEATIDEARIFNQYASPVLKFLAIGAAHLVHQDIPISSDEAGPIFGKFFAAAVDLENIIRWHERTPHLASLDAQTLSVAMTEAGNPRTAGTATLQAIEAAWQTFEGLEHPADSPARNLIEQMYQQTTSTPQAELEKGWAGSWLNAHPVQTISSTGGTTPPPGSTPGHLPPSYSQQLGNVVEPGPYGRPIYFDGQPTGKYAVSWYNPAPSQLAKTFPGLTLGQLHPPPTPPAPGAPAKPPGAPPPAQAPHQGLTIGVQFGQVLTDTVSIPVHESQFDTENYPHATLVWFLDNQQMGTGEHLPLNTRQHANGEHHLKVILRGQRGEIHDQSTTSITIRNQHEPPPPQKGPTPPPPPPRPIANGDGTPPPPIPPIEGQEATLATCCYELLLMLFQLVMQTWFIGKHQPAEAAALTAIAGELAIGSTAAHGIVEALTTIAGKLPPSTDYAALVDGVKCICDAIKGFAPGSTDGIAEQLKRIADEQQAHDAEDIASPELLDTLVAQGLLDEDTRRLFQSGVLTRIDIGLHLPKLWKWIKSEGAIADRFSDEAAHVVVRALKSLVKWIINETEPFFKQAASGAEKLARDIDPAFTALFDALAEAETFLPRKIFDKTVSMVFKDGPPTAENVEEKALALHGAAFMVGQGVHLLAELAGYLKYPASSVWKSNAELLVEMLAYKEILHSFHSAFWPIAITERAKQRYNQKFTPHIPSAAQGYQAFTRGKLDAATRDALNSWNGRDPHYTGFEQSLAYRPIHAFMLARGFHNNAPPAPLLQKIITDQGIEPQFHDVMEQIINDACYQNLYDTFANGALSACEAGAMNLDELDEHLQAANWDHKARSLARQIALIARQKVIAQQTEQAAITELKGGAITEQEARSLLKSGGVDDWRIETTVAIANAQAAFTAARKLQAEEQRMLKVTLAEGQAAIEAQYLAGNLNDFALTAALGAALDAYLAEYQTFGATPQEIAAATTFGRLEIAAIVTKLDAKKNGTATLRYGKSMTRADAQLLDERVNAVKEAFIKSDITEENLMHHLLALGLDKNHAGPLITRWEQQISKAGTSPIQ